MPNSLKELVKKINPTEKQKQKMYDEIMKQYMNPSLKERFFSSFYCRKWWIRTMIPFAFIVLLIAAVFPFLKVDTSFSVYAHGTDMEINEKAMMLSTGIIHNSGSMQGNLLQFNVQGKNIEKIRFSVKNQYMEFTDWTEQRTNFYKEKQFTVPYGEKESDYYYLVVNWIPDHTISELTNNRDSTIANLSKELKNDIIVMEITYLDGTTETKAIAITIKDNGKVQAQLLDYDVTEKDTFVLHPKKPNRNQNKNEKPDHPQNDVNSSYSKKEIEAAKEIAQTYYSRIQFPKDREIVEINYVADSDEYNHYILDSYKDWQIITFEAYEKSMEIPRHIFLARENNSKKWVVINEGY